MGFLIEGLKIVEECEQLLQMNIRSVEMAGADGAMQPTLNGEDQLQGIWDTSCAPALGPWPDFNAFRQNVIDLANGASLDTGVAAVFQSAVAANDASNTNTFRPILQAMGICIQTWWFNIYIWRRV